MFRHGVLWGLQQVFGILNALAMWAALDAANWISFSISLACVLVTACWYIPPPDEKGKNQ